VTSVKVHQRPGGNSNFSLGWDTPDAPPKKGAVTQPAPAPQVEEAKATDPPQENVNPQIPAGNVNPAP
jgi:hypothetical protein